MLASRNIRTDLSYFLNLRLARLSQFKPLVSGRHRRAQSLFHFGNEPIPATRDGFDVDGLLGAVAESFSELLDVKGEVRLFDKDIRPELVHQLRFLDDAAGILEQDQQRIKHLRRHPHWLAIAPQHFLIGIHSEFPEPVEMIDWQ
ncbi:MAG TPA: hypothetical protein PLK30_03190 [Blastocatellia bacterium]|nr:hypothetical protein [Blastocatellia bacterium]